jgi:broad specificity phosphatase PhoE
MHGVLKLLFIRHAQSTGNLEKRMQGHGEFDLTDLGRQQAEALAKRLLIEGWLPTQVYTSPLRRAMQTTQILVDHLKTAGLPAAVSDLIDPSVQAVGDPAPLEKLGEVPIVPAEALKEFQNGIFQGLTWGETMQQYPDLCHQLESSPDWLPIPGAETLQEARSRAQQFIQTLLQRHQNGDRLWIVTHSWILQHLIAELLGCDRSWRLHARNTALFEFWLDRDRWFTPDQNRFNTDLWQVRRFNDAHHLEES